MGLKRRHLVVLVLAGAAALSGSAVAVVAAPTLERSGAGIAAVTVVEEFAEVERGSSTQWTGGLGLANITVPARQVNLVRVRFSGASFCAQGLLAGNCQLRVTWRRAGTAGWNVAAPGAVRIDAHLAPGSEAFEAITAPLDPGSYDVRLEWWAPDEAVFGFTDYTIVFERIVQEVG
jgi:hypothetical protein